MDKPVGTGVRLAINSRTGAGVECDVEAMHWLEIVAGLQLEPQFQMITRLETRIADAPGKVSDPGLRPSSRGDESWPSLALTRIPRQAVGGVDLIFHPFAMPALFSPLPQAVLFSPATAARPRGLSGRLAWAAAQAARANADLRFVYGDSSAAGDVAAEPLEPWVSPGFAPKPGAQASHLPAGIPGGQPYLLCHGLSPHGADLLSAAWSWVAGSVGDEFALLILGATNEAQSRMWDWAREHGWQGSLYFYACDNLVELSGIYSRALVFLQIDPILSGQGLRWAQASGAAIAGFAHGLTAMITGPAGYLVRGGDARQLGAAILTLLVEEDLRQELRGKGLAQARRYLGTDLPGILAARFQAFLASEPG